MVFICTAITFNGRQRYFGRNLDLEFVYGEKVVVTPRNFPLEFRFTETLKSHYAMIGMALVQNDYPLYFDATNEKGLSMAGLNFSKNAVYNPLKCDKDNIASFELIPFILGQCACVSQAEKLLEIYGNGAKEGLLEDIRIRSKEALLEEESLNGLLLQKKKYLEQLKTGSPVGMSEAMTTVMEYMERYHTGKVISGCDYLTGMEVSARKRLL